MELNDFVMVIDNAISDDLCDNIIDVFNSHKPEISGVGKGSVVYDIRNSDEYNISIDHQLQALHKTLTNHIVNVYKTYQHEMPIGIMQHVPCENHEISIESFRIKHYLKGEGYYHEHVDCIGKRIFAVIFYLNTVEEGGETEFLHIDVEAVKPVKGRAVIFPTTWQYPHAGRIPIRGDKYIVQGYINDDLDV